MSNFLNGLTLAAMMMIGTAALAQETATDATDSTAESAAPATEAAEGAAPAEGTVDLNLGEEVADEPQLGQPYVRETLGDWQLECIKVEEGQDQPCQMFQALSDANGNSVANVRFFRLPKGGKAIAGGLIAVPLETLLTAQLTIAIDGANAKRYPFSVCDQLGCYARIGLTQEDVNRFKRGAKASVTLVPFVAPDQKVSLDMSLSGFTAGFEKATVISNK